MQGGAVHNGKNAHNVYGFFRKRWASRSAEEKRSKHRKVAPPYSHARSSFRSQHQLDDFFRDIWLEAFSMPLVAGRRSRGWRSVRVGSWAWDSEGAEARHASRRGFE